jgi:alcohol dehydrogenase
VSGAWWLRQAKVAVDPVGMAAGRVMLERAADKRLARVREAAVDSLRQRVRPSRRRMSALVLSPGGRIAWKSVPAPPAPGPLGAVVRPLAIATCDMDRPLALGATPFPTPLHLGHECVGEVLAIGSDVAGLTLGQRVVVPFQISCGHCIACVSGRTANCLTVPPISMYGFGLAGGHWGGAIAEELAVPFADGMLVPLPDGIDPAAAASVADNVCDAYRHVAPQVRSFAEQGRQPRVLIVGAVTRRHRFTASVALYTALIARAVGAADIVLADARASVRQEALLLGIDAVTPREARALGPAPVVADTSGAPAGLRLSLELTAPDGICSSVGALHAGIRIPVGLMFGRNATLNVGRVHARAVIPQVLELMRGPGLRPEQVTTLVAPIADGHTALAEHVRGGSTKTVLTAA